MLKEKNELIRLKTKITKKQNQLFEIMYQLDINNYSDNRVKNLVGEIEILLEILDTKLFYYKELQNNFWK